MDWPYIILPSIKFLMPRLRPFGIWGWTCSNNKKTKDMWKEGEHVPGDERCDADQHCGGAGKLVEGSPDVLVGG